MSIEVKWQGELRFQASNGQGYSISIDSDSQSAQCPTEVLLSALGSCSSTDVLLGLQEAGASITGFSNRLTYELTEEEPRLYRSVNLHFIIEGSDISNAQIKAAASNALEKFCHVCLMLQPKMALTYSYELV